MAVAQLTLSEALTRPPLGRISTQSQGSPPPRIDLDIDRSSPFDDDRSPCSSDAASPVDSFHTAHDRVSDLTLATLVSSLERDSSLRRRPTSLTIPTVGFGEPLFSSYPFQMSGGPNAADTTITEASSSTTWADDGRPSPPAADSGNIKDSSDIARASSLDRTRTPSTASLSRSRSASAVGIIKAAQDLSSNYGGHLQPRSRARHNRRASLTSGEFDVGRWREMNVPAFEHSVPYAFGQRQDDDYTLESVKMASGLRPLSPVPSLTSRRHSSLITTDSDLFKLADLSISKKVEAESEQLVDDDRFFYDKDDQRIAADGASFVSQPSTLSPSTMTKSLPSTKTSLSRSARSGKEGEPIDVQLAKKLSETANALINRRRMVLLEIVETEVTYVHDLRALVKIYLPHLATLPHVSERVHHLITRNTTELLDFHVQFAAHMVDILKHCDMGYEDTDAETIDHATKRIADLFVREATCFALYDDYCAGSTTAAAVIRNIAHRADYESFEQQCQAASSGMPHTTLFDILTDQTPQPCRTRLRFKDILITPVQRICRYPLLLASLLADVQGELPPPDVVAAIESAQSAMRAVAESADDARQRQEAELKTAAVADRLEPIPALSFDLLRSLGVCRLIGALDVLYHHPTDAPLENPVKVRHLAAFLYNGYLILAKCRRNRMFEPKHYLPLEMFEFIDITEGFLPHSIRLSLNDHNFDLASSCDAEKDLWACELCAARDESTIPPFELPLSIRITSQTTRHSSVITSNDEDTETPGEAKRHTILGNELVQSPLEGSEADLWSAKATPRRTPAPSPVTRSPEYRRSQSSTLLLRRASTTQRLHVDRCLADVMSESLATARSRAQLQTHSTQAYDSRRISLLDSPMLRRRRSIADVRPSMDIVNPTEVRGAVMPSRPNSRRLARTRSCIIADRGGVDGPSIMSTLSRDTSMSSLVDSPDIPPNLRSLRPSLSLRRLDIAMTPKHSERPSRRKTISRTPAAGLSVPTLSRARSMPTSPQLGPSHRSVNSSRTEMKSHSRHHSSSGSVTTRVHSRHNSRSSPAETAGMRRQPSLSGSTTDDDYVMIKSIAEYPKSPRRHVSSVGATAQLPRSLSPVRNADAEVEESATGATPGSSTTPVSGISRSPSLLRSPGLLLRSPSRMIRSRARTSEFPPSAMRRSASYVEADPSLSSSHSRTSDTSLPSSHSGQSGGSLSGGSLGLYASESRPPPTTLRMRSLSGVSLGRAFSYRSGSGASNTRNSTPPSEVVAADTDTSGASGTPTPPNGPVTGPRRRRSMRFFGNLRAFTPYHER